MKSNLLVAECYRNQGNLNIEQGINIWHLLNHVLWADIPGDVIELGCFCGDTSALIAKIIEESNKPKLLYLYDSFEGLPEPTSEDGKIPFIKGSFNRASLLDTVKSRFSDLIPEKVQIVPGWFCDTLPHTLPEQIAFAHLDSDLYAPIKESLEAVYPRLSKGAIVVVDDYCDDELSRIIEEAYNVNLYSKKNETSYVIHNWVPAVKRACEEFLEDKPEEITVLIAGEEKHGFFRKV